MRKPSAMGTSTTCTMDRNISTTFTSTVWPANSRTSSGVTIGAMMVVHAVMPTDSATSPFARYVMTLELVPPGHEPTRITPTASSGGSWNTIVSRNASTGMMTNCARMPTMLEGHAHAEHHDAQQDVHVAGLHDGGHGGKDQGDNRNGECDDRHVLSREVADLGKRLHREFLSRR